MSQYPVGISQLRRVQLIPEITRAFWSRKRAWQGEKIKLFAESVYVPDGTEASVHIWEDGVDTSSEDRMIDKLKQPLVFNHNRATTEYVVDWDSKTLGKDLRLEGASFEFYFVVAIERFKIQQKSTLLYVDLHDFQLSG